MKMSFRNLLAFLTLGALLHGVIQIKSFLNENFVYNDTAIKRKFNHALNGFQPTENLKKRDESETKKSPTARLQE